MGFITPETTDKLQGYHTPSAGLKFDDVFNGLAAISKVPAAIWGQTLAYLAFSEGSQDQSAGAPAAAGDFGFKILTFSIPVMQTLPFPRRPRVLPSQNNCLSTCSRPGPKSWGVFSITVHDQDIH